MKYIFFTTGAEPWFKLASRLHEVGIATPVLWIGDPRHEEAARQKFGDAVVHSMDTLVHFPWRLCGVEYAGTHDAFFVSPEYYMAKDRALKMMDRLDVHGAFSRLDREVFFKNICLWGLKKVTDAGPDALMMTEAPHSHAQFTLYMICRHLKIPAFKLQASPIVPALAVKAMDEDVIVRPESAREGPIYDRMRSELVAYVEKISALGLGAHHEPVYLASQRKNSSGWGRVSRLFTRKFLRLWASRFYQRAKFLRRREYNPYSPSVLQLLISGATTAAKRSFLSVNYAAASEDMPDLERDFVYFGLHYEPERSTNPDGGAFHDQVLALSALRRMLPEAVPIYVKEHPSQLYHSMRGTLGRSPLFYSHVRNLAGVTLVSLKTSSVDLIQKAKFVSTITGSLGSEAAIQGKKALIFGDAWYGDMPNVIKWREDLRYDDIVTQPIHSTQEIIDHLMHRLDTEQFAGCNNTSAELRFARYLAPEFRALEADALFEAMCALADYVTPKK